MLINTKFDAPLEEDVVFEDSETLQSIEELLKNSENLYKGYLYLKKMFSSSPLLNKIIKLETVSYKGKTEYPFEEEANVVTVKNISEDNVSVFLNDGEFVLLPYETFDFPKGTDDIVALKGNFSIIQAKYTD